MSAELQDNRDWGVFIPSFLDDFGLDPFEFRLYSHIARRSGNGGKCWEKIDNIAAVCRMERKTAYRAFQFLEDHKLISVERRLGKTSIITLNHQSEWIPVEQEVKSDRPSVSTCTKNGTPTCTKNGIGEVSQKRDTTCAKNGTPTYTKNGTPPVPKTAHKGIPSKVLPNEVNPSKEDPYRSARKKSETVLEVLENSALVEETIISEPRHELGKEIPPAPLSPPEVSAIALVPKPIAKSSRKTNEVSDEDLLPFKHIWNREAPAPCVRIKNDLTIEQKKSLRRMIKQYGDRTIEIFQGGLAYARTDDWWKNPKRHLSLGNYLTNGKPEEYAQKYQYLVDAGLAVPISEIDLDMESADPEMTPARLKMAQDYDMIGRVLANAGHMKMPPMRVAS
jgi:hypothetical protein